MCPTASSDTPQTESPKTEENISEDVLSTAPRVSRDKVVRRNVLLDLWWVVKHNPVNLDILNKLRTGEDRQFGRDMDIMGKIHELPTDDGRVEDKTETGLVGIRNRLWKPPKEDRQDYLDSLQRKRRTELKREVRDGGGRLNAEEKRQYEALAATDPALNAGPDDIDMSRLVIKIFNNTAKNISWRGTVEECTALEVQRSFGRRGARMGFAVILSGFEYMVTLEHHHPCLDILPTYSFCYWDEKAKALRPITIRQKLVSFGVDFNIFAEGRKIGVIDGKLISMGHNSNIRLFDETLAGDNRFMDILLLFTCTVGFHKAIRKNIRRRIKGLKGKLLNHHVVDRDEMWLMKNPRRIVR